MILYIVRHAIAVPRDPGGSPDAGRPLTPKGIRRMRKAAAGMRDLGVAPALVLSSPWVRARQTAEILVEELDPRAELEEMEALAPPVDRHLVYERLRNAGPAEAVMLVGHQPSLGEIAGELACGSAGCFLALKKGALCVIELARLSPAPGGRLAGLLQPSVLRRLGRRKAGQK